MITSSRLCRILLSARKIGVILSISAIVATPSLRGVEIPAAAAGPVGSANTPGFLVRSAQSPAFPELVQSLNRGLFQLNGTLRDEAGTVVPDEATQGPNPDGSFAIDDIINFQKDATPDIGNFLDDVLFPGIPGASLHTENFATEVVVFLELTAGEHEFGGQVWIERTDVGGGGDDDYFAVFSDVNARDFLATKLTEYARSAEAPAFASVPDDHIYTFTAPVDGVYPFRFVYVQKTRGATLELYSVNNGRWIPLNDPDDPNAIKAYRMSSTAAHNRTYIAEVRPQPGSAGIPPADPVEILLIDGGAAVVPGSIKLFLNDDEVTGGLDVTRDDDAGRTAIRFQPDPGRTNQDNHWRLEFADASGMQTRTWSYISAPADPQPPKATGHWDINGSLVATIGRDLEFFSALAEQQTQFGTTADFGIPPIGGEVAQVMAVPGDQNREIGYRMFHGIPPNGGGTRVNQYTLIMDVMVCDAGPGFAGILQVDSPTNTGDADIFWARGSGNMGQGTGGYGGLGEFTGDAWHRVALAVDLAANPRVVTKFIDGVKQEDWFQQSLDQPRRALLDPIILFTDGDDGEQHCWYVNSVQMRDGKVSDAELIELGGPTAEGIPTPSLVPFIIIDVERDPTSGDVTIEWNSRPGSSYAIDYSTDLESGRWPELTDSYPSQGTTTRYTRTGADILRDIDAAPGEETGQYFLRVRLEE